MSMAKKTKADKKTKSTVNKVSYHYRPDNMTLQDWQIALRRQAAMKEKFVIFERDKKEYPGYYTVINPTSGFISKNFTEYQMFQYIGLFCEMSVSCHVGTS